MSADRRIDTARGGDPRLPRQALLLAGGRGKRIGNVARGRPKCLLAVQGASVVERLVDRLRDASISTCTVVTCHRAADVEAHLGDGRHLGVSIDYLHEPQPLGTAGCLGLIRRPAEPFLLVNADIVTNACFRTLGERHVASGAAATIAVRRHVTTGEFGEVDFDAAGILSAYREKPVHEAFIGMGIACLDPRACDHVRRGEPLPLPELLARLMAAGERVLCHRDDSTWLDIGRPADYEAAQRLSLPPVRCVAERRAA